MKTCSRCGGSKPVDGFHRNRTKRDGRADWCRQCASEHQRSDAGHAAQGRYNRSAKGKTRKARADQLTRARYPEKVKAHQAVKRAVKAGKLERPDVCSRCGGGGKPKRNGAAAIEAHHPDYNKPLEVEWLCRECHLVAG